MPTPSKIPTGVKYAAGAVVLYLALKAFNIINFAKNVLVEFKQFRLGGSILSPQVYMTFQVSNPTNATVTIDGITGNVFFQSQNIATVFSQQSYQIEAYKKTDVELMAVSNITDLLSIIKPFMSGGYRNQLNFQGSILVNNISLPINFNLV